MLRGLLHRLLLTLLPGSVPPRPEPLAATPLPVEPRSKLSPLRFCDCVVTKSATDPKVYR